MAKSKTIDAAESKPMIKVAERAENTVDSSSIDRLSKQQEKRILKDSLVDKKNPAYVAKTKKIFSRTLYKIKKRKEKQYIKNSKIIESLKLSKDNAIIEYKFDFDYNFEMKREDHIKIISDHVSFYLNKYPGNLSKLALKDAFFSALKEADLQVEHHAPSLAKPIPAVAPALWAERTTGREVSPVDFIKQHYGEWIGGGLALADIRRLDPKLYQAYATFVSRDPSRDLKLPKQIGAPPMSGPPVEVLAHKRELMRAASARYRRQRQKR